MTKSRRTARPLSPGVDNPEQTAAAKPTKIASVLELLGRSQGASLDELVTTTGWLPHTTRAALTGLKKKGHSVAREKVAGVTRYRIAAAASQ